MEDSSKPPGTFIKTQSILLHQCCAPCSVYPLTRLMADGWDAFGYFFNPNIHPYTEFIKRLECVETHNKRVGIEYYIDSEDALRPFLKAALLAEDAGVPRCGACYRLRLAKAAKFAKENGFSFFTTTLLYSRHQDHSLIVSIAGECAEENEIEFYYEDFRKGWQAGIARSKELNMYRQSYCGCIFSEAERKNIKPSVSEALLRASTP